MGMEPGQMAYIAVWGPGELPSGVLQLVFNTPKGNLPGATSIEVRKLPHDIDPSHSLSRIHVPVPQSPLPLPSCSVVQLSRVSIVIRLV